ncbi:MAG TPA: hypothetical protein VGH74_16360 [Planctomycetaceae bacterium]
MPKGKKGTRLSYTAAMMDLKAWARGRLHVCSRSHRYGDRQRFHCERCGRAFDITSSCRGWKPVLSPGEDCQAFCPASVFGHGEGI